jgi:hypothetical protein
MAEQQIDLIERQHFAADLALQAALAADEKETAENEFGKMQKLEKAHVAALAALGNMPEAEELEVEEE